MAYDKPKVTIDLDEYNELLAEKNRIIGDEFVLLARTVIATLLNNQMNPRKAEEDLKSLGIGFFVNESMTSVGRILPENISIFKITNDKA